MCFIFSVELESLGPLLGQITVALSSLVDDYSQQVSSIFEFLIVTNKYVDMIIIICMSTFTNHVTLFQTTTHVVLLHGNKE